MCADERSRSWRRHQRERIINNRIDMAKSVWFSDDNEIPIGNDKWLKPGKFNKWNGSCNCWACRWDKKADVPTIHELRMRDKESSSVEDYE